MRVGSLFSGYGGLDMAVSGDLAWYSEIEPAACKVMEAHHPGVPNLGDITKVNWAEVEPVDVITGGYPCQPFSNAGSRKGTQDDRHLWPYVRDALGAIRPAAAVLENVRGHLTLGFDVVLSDLAELGWSARWGVVRAADAGAPHNRARLFIVAYAASDKRNGRPVGHDAQHEGTTRLLQVSVGGNGGDIANPNSPGSQTHDDGRPRRGDTRRPQPVECGGPNVANTNEQRLQHASVGVDDGPQSSATTGHSSATTHPSSQRHGGGQRPAGLGRVGGKTEGSRRQASTARQEFGAGSVEDVADTNRTPREHSLSGVGVSDIIGCDWGDYAPAIDRWQHVIGRTAPRPTIQRAGRDRLNPVFVEWMMGLPEGWVTGHGLSASQELKMLGNGVVPQQAALALRLLGAA